MWVKTSSLYPGCVACAGLFCRSVMVVSDYALIWDSRVYYQSILNAQAQPFDILNYSGGIVSTGGHNGQLWAWLAGLPNYIFPGNYYAYNAWIALLGTTEVVAFFYIVAALSARFFSISECLLVTALFAFHPSVLASQVHVTPDTGLLIFWVWFFLALLKEKTIAASIIGCFLLFSKEPAMAHLPIIFIFVALLQPQGDRMRWIKKHCLAVCAPFCMYGIFLFYKAEFRHKPLFFSWIFAEFSLPSIKGYPDAQPYQFTH